MSLKESFKPQPTDVEKLTTDQVRFSSMLLTSSHMRLNLFGYFESFLARRKLESPRSRSNRPLWQSVLDKQRKHCHELTPTGLGHENVSNSNDHSSRSSGAHSTAFFQDNLGKQLPERLTILDYNEARDDGWHWQWHQLDHMQLICSSLLTDNHASTPLLSFYRPYDLPAAQSTALLLSSPRSHNAWCNGYKIQLWAVSLSRSDLGQVVHTRDALRLGR